jgi:serine/threonine-protein kinase
MVAGETLAYRLTAGKVHEAEAIKLFRHILHGLAELHRHQIHLRHYTPKSLRINQDGILVFAETGLLNRLHVISKMTTEMMYIDTPMYATPERIHGRTVDTRSDIYIAGLIGYEMIAGVPVYHKGSIKDVLYAHVAEPVPDLPNKNHPLNSLFQKMLHKIPGERFQTAEAVLTQLQALSG